VLLFEISTGSSSISLSVAVVRNASSGGFSPHAIWLNMTLYGDRIPRLVWGGRFIERAIRSSAVAHFFGS
jgi:hypothetical protein